MLHTDTKTEIDRRVKALNLNLKRLAGMAGVDPMTVYRGPRRLDTHGKVMCALEAEELRLRDYLLALHPTPAARP